MLDDEERIDPMARIFPKITKCTFHNFGASGTIQKYYILTKKINHPFLVRFDGLCILPINMINDKIYITLWFWLFLLLIMSVLYMIFRLE